MIVFNVKSLFLGRNTILLDFLIQYTKGKPRGAKEDTKEPRGVKEDTKGKPRGAKEDTKGKPRGAKEGTK